MSIEFRYIVRQKGVYSKYCYYAGFNDKKHMWTKKQTNAVWYSNIKEAEDIRKKLRFNYPKIVKIKIRDRNIIKEKQTI